MPDAQHPSNWMLARLGDLGEIRTGRQKSAAGPGPGAIPYLRAANIGRAGLLLDDVLEMEFDERERSVYELRQGDILLAEASGSAEHVGRCAMWRGELPLCCFQNTVLRFRSSVLLPDFALVLFRHLAASGSFRELARGVGILHLGATRLASIEVAVPPLAEQRRIARECGRRLEEMRLAEQALLASLDHIEEQDVTILRWVASGGGGAGEDRRDVDGSLASAAIADLGEVALGKKREPTSHEGENMLPYLRVANVLEDRIDYQDVLRMHFDEKEAGRYELRPGDILLNEGQSPELVGRPAMYRGEVAPICFQMTLLRFRAGPRMDPEYSLLVFRHWLHEGVFRAAARWSTNIAHLSKRRFAEMHMPVPPLDRQLELAKEARRRREVSGGQREAVARSRGRIPRAGAAVRLEERVGEGAGGDPSKGSSAKRMVVREAVMGDESDLGADETSGGVGKARLAGALAASGGSLSLPDLFRAAGYDRHSLDDVEAFYRELEAEATAGAVKAGGADENAMVSGVDAPR